MQDFSTRCQDRQARGGREEPTDEGCAVDELLEVVENEQQVEVTQVRLERLADGSLGVFRQPDRMRDRGRDQT